MKAVYTSNAPEAIGPYSQAIISDKMLYSSGQIPINPATGQIDKDTIEEQTHQVIHNLEAVLKEAGSSLRDVVKTTCFIADMNDFAAFNTVYSQYFTNKPARSCVEVSKLPKGALLEIEVIANIGKA